MVAVQNLEEEIIQLVTHSSSFSSESCYLENLKTYAVFYTRPSIPLPTKCQRISKRPISLISILKLKMSSTIEYKNVLSCGGINLTGIL
jgi:hypothetical protein